MYHDLCLGGKALTARENVGFDLTKSDLCPSFVKDLTAKGVSLCVVDSHTGNHRKDGFTPLETIQRFIGLNTAYPIPWIRRIDPAVQFLFFSNQRLVGDTTAVIFLILKQRSTKRD
ncbi:hypothetical protein Tco_0896826 [Tanacetum coccineum]